MSNGLNSMVYGGDYLEHHGIKGMHWGERRFQDEQGRWTAAGRERYSTAGDEQKSITPRSREKHVTNNSKGIKRREVANSAPNQAKQTNKKALEETKSLINEKISSATKHNDNYNAHERSITNGIKTKNRKLISNAGKDLVDALTSSLASNTTGDAMGVINAYYARETASPEDAAKYMTAIYIEILDELYSEEGLAEINDGALDQLTPANLFNLFNELMTDSGITAHTPQDLLYVSKDAVMNAMYKKINSMTIYTVPKDDVEHSGIKGMHWGDRRFQNEDGSWTAAGRERYGKGGVNFSSREMRAAQRKAAAIERKDMKWAAKNQSKIEQKAFKKSKRDMEKYKKNVLDKQFGQVATRTYMNAYNKVLSDLMTKNAEGMKAPSGKLVKFVAKRGEFGVMMALADEGYDMSQVKNGLYADGRIAYKKDVIERKGYE